MQAEKRRKRNRKLRASFLIVLIGLASVAAYRWWAVRERDQWLRGASIEQLATAAYKNQNDVAIFETLGARTLKNEEWHRAARAYQRACEIAPDRVENWVGWARSIYEFGGFRAADAILSAYIKDHPRNARAYTERAALRRRARRTEMAWHDADEATRLDPNYGEAWALRGDLSLDQGISGEGEQSFLKARKLLPNSPWGYVGLYQSYIYQKRADDAVKTARIIVERFPQVDEGKLYLGEGLLLGAKSPADYDAARAVLLEAAKHADHYRTMDRSANHFLIGKSYYSQGRWKDALRHFELADAISPGNPDLLFLLGRTYRTVGDAKMAGETMKRHRKVYDQTEKVRQYNARINAQPTDPRPRLEFAQWYRQNGMASNALIQYEEMVMRGLEIETAKREMKELEAAGVTPP